MKRFFFLLRRASFLDDETAHKEKVEITKRAPKKIAEEENRKKSAVFSLPIHKRRDLFAVDTVVK